MSYCVPFLSFKQDGEIVPQNLHNFLSDADFPSNENKCPESWHTAVKGLHNEMTTHVVITASAFMFRLEMLIVDWKGVCDINFNDVVFALFYLYIY